MGSGGGTDSDRERKTEHLGTVVENLPVILFTIDSDGTFTMSRGKALESLGLEPGQVVGSTIEELYEDQPEILTKFERALAGEEVRYTATVGGRVFETWLQPITDDAGTIREVLGLSQDITDQKTYEQELKENDAILKQLTETTDDVFWLFNRGAKGSGSSGSGLGLFFIETMVDTYDGEIRFEPADPGRDLS